MRKYLLKMKMNMNMKMTVKSFGMNGFNLIGEKSIVPTHFVFMILVEKNVFFFKFYAEIIWKRRQRQIHRKVSKNYILFWKWFLYFSPIKLFEIFNTPNRVRVWVRVCLCATEMWNERNCYHDRWVHLIQKFFATVTILICV